MRLLGVLGLLCLVLVSCADGGEPLVNKTSDATFTMSQPLGDDLSVLWEVELQGVVELPASSSGSCWAAFFVMTPTDLGYLAMTLSGNVQIHGVAGSPGEGSPSPPVQSDSAFAEASGAEDRCSSPEIAEGPYVAPSRSGDSVTVGTPTGIVAYFEMASQEGPERVFFYDSYSMEPLVDLTALMLDEVPSIRLEGSVTDVQTPAPVVVVDTGVTTITEYLGSYRVPALSNDVDCWAVLADFTLEEQRQTSDSLRGLYPPRLVAEGRSWGGFAGTDLCDVSEVADRFVEANSLFERAPEVGETVRVYWMFSGEAEDIQAMVAYGEHPGSTKRVPNGFSPETAFTFEVLTSLPPA